MTKEVAEKIVRGITDKIECNTADIDDWAEFWGFTREEYEAFLDMAIKALEKEPCWDCISRQAAIDILDDLACDYESGKWNNSHSEARGRMINLPSVEPERKTGKWIWEDGNIPYCSNCKKYSDDADMQDIHGEVLYCPHCGAKMKGDVNCNAED